ncbi:MAG TPA: hypothetical protein VF624_15090 [Tepidisphaeraceae bacterium]|jgi:hypothetical protein
MQIDLDTILAKVTPGPLEVVIRGHTYKARELTVADVVMLASIEGLSNDEVDGFYRSVFGPTMPLLDATAAAYAERSAAVAAAKEYIGDAVAADDSVQALCAAVLQRDRGSVAQVLVRSLGAADRGAELVDLEMASLLSALTLYAKEGHNLGKRLARVMEAMREQIAAAMAPSTSSST